MTRLFVRVAKWLMPATSAWRAVSFSMSRTQVMSSLM
jgi:hypothetical protein